MKLYVAGRTTDLANVIPIAEALKDEGHEITFEWWGGEGEIRTDLRSEDLDLIFDEVPPEEVQTIEPNSAWTTTVKHKPTGETATGEGSSKVASHDVAVNRLRAKLNAGWRDNPERARELATRELMAVGDADGLVLVWAEDILGAAIETGVAMAFVLDDEMKVWVYRPGRDSVFWYLPNVTQVQSKTELMESIGLYEKGLE